jgi:hypothetical protein
MMAGVKAPVDEESFEVNIDFNDGPIVVIQVRYPRGQAVKGIQALSAAAETERITGLFHALRHDPSVRARLDELHLGFDDDEDEW